MEQEDKKAISGPKLIDLEAVIKSKSEKLHRRLPKFVLRYLERITHVKELNEFLSKHHDKLGFDFVQAGVDDFNLQITHEGLENIPESGGQFIAANHPLGGLDGMTMTHIVGKIRRDIKFPVNDILMSLGNMSPIFVPINKHGRNTENIGTLEENFAKEQMILFFPAGLVSRRHKGGEIKDLEWKHTLINKAIKYKKDIIPTYIHAKNTKFFYNLAYWRKKLGIKANIEMLYLVDEVYKQRNAKIHFRFGKPIPYTHFDKSKSPREWAKWLQEHVYYDLAKGLHTKK
jgi:putative hemolysin